MNQGIFTPLSIVALESIDFQVKDKCVKRLEIIFEDIAELVKNKGKIDESDRRAFSELIRSELRKRFKLEKLNFEIYQNDQIDAFALQPDVTRNSVMFKTMTGYATKASTGTMLLNSVNELTGGVNLKEATVDGFFKGVPCYIAISTALAESDNYSPVEKVAVIMHEVGHLFTYLETLGYTFSTCFTLMDTLARLNSAHSDEAKTKIYKNLEDATGIEVKDKDILIKNEDEDVAVVGIFKSMNDQLSSEFGSSIYDMRSFESLSDQFSARMGLSVPLASALDKLSRDGADKSSYGGNFRASILNIVRWLLLVAVTIKLPLIGAIFLIVEILAIKVSPLERIYDKPGERITRLRNEVIAQMKKSTIDDEHRKALALDLGAIDAILEHIEDKESYVEKMWLFFSANSRDQKARRILLQDLQALTNNDLFAHANLLKTLKG